MYVDTAPSTIRNRNGNDLYTGDNSDGIQYKLGSSGCNMGTVLVLLAVPVIGTGASIDNDDDDDEVDFNLLLGTIGFGIGTIFIRLCRSSLTLGLLYGRRNCIGRKEASKFNPMFVRIAIVLREWIVTIFTHNTVK